MSKMDYKKVIVVLSLIALIVTTFVVMAKAGGEADAASLIKKYEDKNEIEIMEQLKQLTKEELLNEMNILTKDENYSGGDLLYWAVALQEKKSEFSSEQMVEQIKSTKNTMDTKFILLNVFLHNNEIDSTNEAFKQLLVDTDLDETIKPMIISSLEFDTNDEELLIQFITDGGDDVAFASLKQLSRINSEKAYELSYEILKNKENEPAATISAALNAYSVFLKENKDIEEYSKFESVFIEICKDLLKGRKGQTLAETAFFSLSDLMSENGIFTILDSHLELQSKSYAVDQNYSVLKDVLVNDPSEQQLRLVLKAMKIYPIRDLVEDLEAAIVEVSDLELTEEAEIVLENMKENGQAANLKWTTD
ncbi:MAG: hypothetical protein ACK4M9_22060 [Anaerobacillus sp.]|uniref:hypothetical protein n=1 Tax=Anaerobacillus sp. TaxID=1872506 RepID=UPI00391B5250